MCAPPPPLDSAAETFRVLYAEGGVRRFYQGLPCAHHPNPAPRTPAPRTPHPAPCTLTRWALLQTPLTRFGDTAANSGVLLLTLTLTNPNPDPDPD